jgi:hypothetical protein
MVDVSFKVNGRTVNERAFKNSIEGAILEEIQSSVKKKIGYMRCQEHQTLPSVKVEGKSIDRMNLDVDACCEKFEEEVAKKLD